MSYLTCIHRASGLCPTCQADYDYDPQAWIEYGQHEAGEERWKALLEEIATEAALPKAAAPDPNLPW